MNDEELRLNLKNAGKYQLNYLQSNERKWMTFLSQSCNHYSRSFLEQLLIIAGYPNATAVMKENLWQKNNYVVKNGEMGIAVLTNFDGDFQNNQKINGATVKVYYDISQVEKISAKEVYRWNIGNIDENIVIKSLNDNYTNVNTSTFVHTVITAISSEIDNTIKDLDTRNFIINSASYQVLSRCGYNANSIFKSEDFKLVTKFENDKNFIKIATQANELSSSMLKHIAKIVRKHYNESKISVKEEQTNEHNIQSTRRHKQGRTNNNLHQVSQERNEWSVNSDSGRNGRRADGTGRILSEAPEISQGGTSGQIYGADVVGEHNGVSSQHRDDSTEPKGNNNRATEESTGSNRGAESERPNEMGGIDEQHNSISRGDSSNRDSLRLSSNPQVNITDNKAEVDVQNQTSAFSISQQIIDDTLCKGSGFSQGKMRIYEQFEKNLSSKENAEFLKNEYGVGGGSHAGGHDGYSTWHDAKGFSITKGYDDNRPKVFLNWKQVATRIYQLIRMDRYLNSKEKEYYPKWREKQEIKRIELLQLKQERENKSIPAEKENIEYIYKYAVGDKVYLGASEYEVSSISNDDLIILQDIHFPLMEKEMKREEFENALKESIFNDHLKVPKLTFDEETLATELNASDTTEAQEQPISTTKSVDKLQIGDVIRLENQEWTISKIDGDFSVELINNDKTANNSVQKFMGHWKENIAEIGFEYIPPVEKRTKSTPTAKSNYIINDDNLGVGAKPERFQNNINAIRLLKAIESENRLATQEEQEILSKYVGWGGLDKYFKPTHSRYNELRECLTDDEFASASASTLTAFYTPPMVIRAMYKALDNLGFTNGNILEPSCGTGNFMGMLPKNMQNSKMFGVELDSISGRIAKQLYQKNNISIGGYENEKLPDSFFDVAVGNVPFGNFKVSDKRYNKHKFLIHDYFYAKTLDKVRPGGVIAFITAKGTLDKKDNRIRKYLAERATLLGAIRLPNNTFKGAAGTEVTSDILFLQKKEALSLDNPDWLYLKENEDGIVINQYFVDNPDMVLGDIKLISGPYGLEMACVSNDDGTLEEKLNAAVAKIQGQIVTYNKAQDADDVIESTEVTAIPADPTVKNYSYAIVDGDLYFRKNSIMEKQSITGLPEERVRGLIKLRDIVRDLIDYQSNDYPDSDISAKRNELNNEYEKFTKKYGLINSRGNKLAFNQDSSFPLLTSLELLDEDGKLKRKSDIFYKRTIKPYIPVTYAETSIEALAVSLNERGKVDIEYMAKLTGFEQEKVIADLTDIIYPVPGKDEYQTADEYLSGDVRTKLFIAKSVAENDSKYKGNVVALENVQPKDLSAAEVKIRLGATWVDTKYIKQFIDEVFQPGYHTYKINVTYSEYTSKWNITSKSSDTGFLARNTYGTKDYNAYQLLELALNLKTPKVYDVKIIEGQEVKVFNPQKTTVARKKQEKIQEKFEDWIFADPQRRNDLLRKYNDTYNSIRNRTYNGSHLTFPGMNPEITLRPHQVNAIARTLYGGNTLLAHVVGAGKTFEMIASAMEAKRLGLCNKSLFVVPNHLTEQMGSDFLNLYPSANILVATKNDFSTHKRKEFCSRIATGEYDAVIIGHSQFEKIPVSLERQEAFIQEEINDIVNAIAEAKAQNGENFTIKQLEGEKKKLENKMKELYEDKAKDDVVTFEQLGVDRIFVDEAHKFKNLYIRTKMTNVAGITSSSADKSADLLMKCRYIDEITGGKGIVFATGTPVSNSMSELYTMQRYLQFDTLKKLGFAHFDSWASSFGATVTASELAPEGKKYREKTRFAKFFNLPELMNIFRECADIQTADMLNLPVPKAEFKTVVAKPSADQRNFVDECGNRADRVRSGSVDPREDNMLKITTDGRKLAVDQRIVNPELPDFENSKINMCVNNVFEIWQDTAEQRSTQLLFCDLSTPTTDGFNVYDDIRNKLISKGIPPKEIAFIHNYNTDAKKAALFSDVRQGKIRVLLGSTEKMGAGTNIQDKLVALHDLDCPWRPSDLEQRLGRILRQGNENEEVYVFRYVTEDTFDAYSYQLIENKQKFISPIMSSKTPVREAEDFDQSALSYAEIKMLATGNPLIKEKMDLDIKQTNLKVLKADYLSNKYKLEDMILNIPKEVAIKERFINELSLDMATVDENPINNDEFKMVLNGTTYTDKKTAGMYLIKLLDTLPHHVKTDEFTVGEYRGFTLSVARRDNQPYAYLKGYLSYSVEMSDDVYGNITRLNNKLSAISDRKYKAVLSLEDYNHQMEKVKLEAQKPFEHEAELKDVTSRLDEVNRMLTTSEQDVEYKGVSEVDVQALKNAGIEFDCVVDSTGKNDYIIKYEKANRQQVQEIIADPLNNSLKR